MKIHVYKGFWNCKVAEGLPECLFIFGDNDAKKGCTGQAIIRNLPNAAGIPTKKFPSNDASSFYTDEEFEENCEKIRNACQIILIKALQYERVVFSGQGLGTGLADLPNKAPKTYKFLIEEVEKLKESLLSLVV